MEKLQPVIKQIFWICFSLAMMLILFGWWSAKGDLTTKIEARDAAVKTAFTDAGQNVSSVPNARWTDGGSKFNEDHEKNFQLSARGLYERQIKARTYPSQIKGELEKLKFNSLIGNMALREKFATDYAAYFRAQMEVIKPFKDGKGLVDTDDANVTYTTWSSKRPTSAEIWKAQEDIWLLRSIFDSIAAVNKGFDLINKAPIRSLQLLQLRGGDRDAPIGGGAAAGGFGGGSDMGMSEGYTSGFGGGEALGGGGTAGGAWAAYEGSLAGDLLSEEFGPVAGAMAGGMGDYDSASGGFGGAAAEPVEEDRYVDDDENLPYRTRAFALTVKILQDDIPALLGELTNSYFPVEIVRVDVAFAAPPAAGGYGGGGYGGGGEDYGDDYGASGYDEGMAGGGGFGGGGFGGGGFGAPAMSGGLGGPPMVAPKRKSKKPLSAKQQKAVTQGERFKLAGLSDSNLCTLRVAGLMTMYRSPAENEAEQETAAKAEEETQQAVESGVGEAPVMENPLEDAGSEADPNGAVPADDGAEMPKEGDAAEGTSPAPSTESAPVEGADGTRAPGAAPPASEPGDAVPATETSGASDAN